MGGTRAGPASRFLRDIPAELIASGTGSVDGGTADRSSGGFAPKRPSWSDWQAPTQGYKVAEAVDGLEAIQMVEHRRYDIILMDINLPDKDGIATFEEIRAIRPDARVIFVTGLEVEETVRKALASDALAIAYKPFDPERILAMVCWRCRGLWYRTNL